MGLTSVSFLLCLAALLIVYYLTPRRAQWLVLLAASILFYLWADLRAGLFLLASILVTWFCACQMERIRAAETDEKRARARCRRVLLAGMLTNLGILAVLKYLNFLLQNFAELTGASLPVLRLLLPLGISYYTFQTVGYLLDVYWKRTQAQTNVLRLALFVSFFPQLVQGPIGWPTGQASSGKRSSRLPSSTAGSRSLGRSSTPWSSTATSPAGSISRSAFRCCSASGWTKTSVGRFSPAR